METTTHGSNRRTRKNQIQHNSASRWGSVRRATNYLAEELEHRMLLAFNAQGVQLDMDETGVSGTLLQLATLGRGTSSATADANQQSMMVDNDQRIAVRVTALDVDALARPLADLGFTDSV